MAVLLTIDGHTLELTGDKNANEVEQLFRARLVEGDNLDRLILLNVRDGGSLYIQPANVTWFAVEERDAATPLVSFR